MSIPKRPRRMARPPQIWDGQVVISNAVAEIGMCSAAPIEKRVSKSSAVLNLLRQESGASLAEIVEATGWLPHTARAALTGLRKKGHIIVREKVDGVTRYSIREGQGE